MRRSKDCRYELPLLAPESGRAPNPRRRFMEDARTAVRDLHFNKKYGKSRFLVAPMN